MHTLLISTVMDIFDKSKDMFCQKRTANLFAQHVLANIVLPSKKPISQLIHVLGEENEDWSNHYRLYSQDKWEDEKLFEPIVESLIPELKKQSYLSINYDETSIPKGGKKIPGVSLQRDPHSPKFRANFKLALRCGQASIQLPITNDHTIARSIPIDFKICPVLKKPSKKATEQEKKEYKIEQKEKTFSKQALYRFKSIRILLDKKGFQNKRILLVVDNAFCNQTIFKANLDRTTVLARARKDSKLCLGAKSPRSNQFFDSITFCPEDVMKDREIGWKRCIIRKKGKRIKVKYKELKNVYWRTGAGRKPLRLLVIAPLRYWKHKAWQYTDAAFLLTDDMQASPKELIQAYNNRWQIEVNHWDEKDVFGLGDAQVRSKKSVERQLRSVVFAYSVVLVAGRKYEVGRQGKLIEGMSRSKWYSERPRWSLRDMTSRLRYEMWNYPECTNNVGLRLDLIKPLIYNAF
jgi:hypothetical protein